MIFHNTIKYGGSDGARTGFEQNQDLSGSGQNSPPLGQNTSYPIDDNNNAHEGNVKHGTNDGQDKTPSGQPKSITGTQQEHNEIAGNPDLKKIFEAWEKLPEAMKQGILLMIESATSSKK